MVFIRGAVGSILLPSFLTLSLAQPLGAKSSLKWGPCNEAEVPSSVPVECTVLDVPLDYTDTSSGETLPLDLVRVPAPVQPSKGGILVNFGGPGATSRNVIGQGGIADELFALTGRNYDLVTFDPRGTAGSKIHFNCFESAADVWAFLGGIRLSNASDEEVGVQWARGKMLADTCYRTQNKTGSLITTAFVARDMMQIVDALDEGGLLRYLGFSYGTTLGATVAAMFPDRVGQMVLDGVQNPYEYYNSQGAFEQWTSSDAEWSAVFTTCVENRDSCALAKGNDKTAAELEQSVWDLLDSLKEHPLSARNYWLDYSYVKTIFINALYSSLGWPGTTRFINSILTGDLDTTVAYLDATGELNATDPYEALATYQGLTGIYCGDNRMRTEKFEDFLPAVEKLYDTSRIIGDASVTVYSACQQWKIEPKERYTGDFTVKTKNPVLFIGNTFDGLTPLVTAKNVSSTFEGSAVLTINGYGHSSLAVPSACTLRTAAAYWDNGTLPVEGLVCESDAPLYSTITWVDVINAVYGNGTAPAKRSLPQPPHYKNFIGRLPI